MARFVMTRTPVGNLGRALIVAGLTLCTNVEETVAQSGLADGKAGKPNTNALSAQDRAVGARDAKAKKQGDAVTGGGEGGRAKQIAPAEPILDAGKPPTPAGVTDRSKEAEAPPETKANELPTSTTGAKELEKMGGNTLVDPALFDPALGGVPGPAFRTGKPKIADRFPTWEDPGLAERNRAMGLDLLTSPLDVTQADESSLVEMGEQGGNDPVPFIAPGFYGRAPNVLFPGQGRAARPWSYNTSFSVINGYDSNGFQVPDSSLSALGQEQGGSFTTGVGLHLDMSWMNAQSVFTFIADGTGTYYWNRDKDKTLFNIPTWAILYSSQLDNQTQLTINFSLNFLSQADFSNINASQSGGGENFLTTSSQINLSHRWAPHFSTNSSLASNLLYFPQGNDNVIAIGGGSNVSGNTLDLTFGNEFRFQTSTKMTWVVEGRYSFQEVFSNSALNSNTLFFLAGLDWIWLKHFTTTIRTGATFRTSDTFGDSTDPYLELSGNLRTGRFSSLNLNARYGFQFSNVIGNNAPSFSLGVNYQQTLGRRLSGTAGINYFNNPSTQGGITASSSESIVLNLGLQYQVNRSFSWNAQYLFTKSDSSFGQQNFNRSLATVAAIFTF